MKKKSQSAIEFVMLVSFMLIIFFIFFLIIQGRITESVKSQDIMYLMEANSLVVSEVELARTSDADFQHIFRLQSVNGQDYDINLSDSLEVVSSYNGQEYINFLLINVTGDLFSDFTSDNTIYKLDGVVRFDNNTLEYFPEYRGIFMNVNPEFCYSETDRNTCNSLTLQQQKDCQKWFTLC